MLWRIMKVWFLWINPSFAQRHIKKGLGEMDENLFSDNSGSKKGLFYSFFDFIIRSLAIIFFIDCFITLYELLILWN